jgi:hypothetical protein
MIKVLICDGEGTLELPNPSEEIRRLIELLPRLDICLAVATNNFDSGNIRARFRQAGLRLPDYIVTRGDMPINPRSGKPYGKPSPLFIRKIQELSGVEPREIVYLGDDDKTDTFCAINACVLPFVALYSSSGNQMEYGIPITQPKAFIDYLSSYAKQDEPYFGWICESPCIDTGTLVDVRALFGEHGEMGLTRPLESLLKDHIEVRIGRNNVLLGTILFHYLVSQTYLSGLIQEIDCVTVYPGHEAFTTNPILEQFSSILKQCFRQRFLSDLIIRHTDAKKSQWTPGAHRDIYEQFRTIKINPEHNRKIKDKSILVLDDFTTSGSSLETARRMLLAAGASKVIGLAMAKFRTDYKKTLIEKEWNPFEECTLVREDITVQRIQGTLNRQADVYFHENIWPVYSA